MESLTSTNWMLLLGAALVLVGVLSSVLANRFGTPLLLVFLVIGMLAGEDGPGGIRFDNVALAYFIGSLALSVILFDGGLRTRAASVREALAPAGLLATVGVLITALLTGVAATLLLGLGWLEGLLLGAVLASTDAAAVFFLLRAGGLHLKRRVAATLEIESGSNDPMAIFLTLLFLELILAGSEASGWMAAGLFLSQLVIGAALGIAGGLLIASALNRLELPAGLHPLFAVASAVTLFALTNTLGGSGFLAAYLAGLVVGNRPVRAFANVLNVQDAATWLAQIVMFLVLGLLASPLRLLDYLLPALGVAAFLMLVARPAAVYACLLWFPFGKRERGFIAWVGLRGAVGIFLASIPLLAGLPNADLFFNVGFVVVLVSLVVQGWTLNFAAHRMGVALPRKDPETRRVELDLPGQLELELVGYPVAPDCALLKGAALPKSARLNLVVRQGQVLTPDQAGPIQAGDHVYFLAPPGRVHRLDWLFVPAEEARAVEREVFGEFVLDGDVPLGSVADFYDLRIPAALKERTAAELFAERFDDRAQVGDRTRLGRAVLVVREMDEDTVTRVGLKFEHVGERLAGGLFR
jgi:cell volume regulation protein A